MIPDNHNMIQQRMKTYQILIQYSKFALKLKFHIKNKNQS